MQKPQSSPSFSPQPQPEYSILHPSSSEEVHYIGPSTPISKILQTQQIFIEQQYEHIKVTIKNVSSQRVIKLETHYYGIEVVSEMGARWEIERRYSDFQWLYHAIIFSYPGCILPYFPEKSIENFMVTKLGIQYGEQSKQQHLNIRKDELQIFLNGICKHPLLKQAEQTKIFLAENKDQFLKHKKSIETQITESQSQQSSSNGLVSIFERSVAWITSSSKAQGYRVENLEGWDGVEKEIRLWVQQYSMLIQKVERLMELKRSETEWQGPETEVDSVEELKARVVSGQQYNKLFQQDLQQNIIKNLEYQAKSLKQLESQLAQRENIISIINYIYKFSSSSSSSSRGNKLLRKKQKFETNMMREWPLFKEVLRVKVRAVQKKFNQIWLKYCRKVQKIWRQR